MDQPRVLVVASDVEAGDLYASILISGAGARTIWVPDAGAAQRLLRRRLQFDAVVIDVSKPSEWESCETLGRCGEPPIVVVTGWLAADGRFRRRAFEAGCAAFVAKPCAPDALVGIVARVRSGERNISC